MIKIAIQKSGRLNEESLGILKKCGISIDNGKDQLKAAARNFPLEVLYLRNGDIPQYLRDGVVDLAIIGENLIHEKGKDLQVIEKLGFSKCRVSVAVPKETVFNDIRELNGKRIATSYPNTVNQFLEENNISAELHIINGSVEIAPNIGLADAICDIVSSGSTLFKNNLKEVTKILDSEAVLVQAPTMDVEKTAIIDKLLFRLRTVLRAKKLKYILLNAPNDKIEEISAILPVLKSPTVLPLAQAGWSSLHSVIDEAQKTQEVRVEIIKGVNCWQKKLPIEKVGLYIPGGSAPLFSTILMLAVPAQVAGCSEIVLCSPPSDNGSLADVILYTADLCGITNIYKVGGMQAIAGMTLGTATVPKVDKLFGPGNQYVTVAKQWATQYQVAIDMPAGPSELMVVADETADPSFVAADLLSQAEHGPDSQVLFVTTNKEMIDKVDAEVENQLVVLSRQATAVKALNNSKIIYFEKREEALSFTNYYGAEHLIVCLENEDDFVSKIKHAGSVFVGNYTPESAGDYASGTNHTLPTNGYVRQYSGVNLDSFLKAITYQKITAEGLQALGSVVEEMATAEGLQAHKNAVSIRLNKLLS